MAKAFVVMVGGELNGSATAMRVVCNGTISDPPITNFVGSIATEEISLNATPAHIARSVIQAAITKGTELGVVLDSSDVILHGFDRG